MFDYTAAPPTTGFSPLPEGTYNLKIVAIEEKKTNKDKFPMVAVTCEVINNEEYNGKTVFHNVTFMPKDRKGAGMSTHFLKCINQPWDGDITVDPIAWQGETFKAKIAIVPFTYNQGKNVGKTVDRNEIKEVMPAEEIAF
jgi:hypothetical protein